MNQETDLWYVINNFIGESESNPSFKSKLCDFTGRHQGKCKITKNINIGIASKISLSQKYKLTSGLNLIIQKIGRPTEFLLFGNFPKYVWNETKVLPQKVTPPFN